MNKWFAGCDNVKLFELHKNFYSGFVFHVTISSPIEIIQTLRYSSGIGVYLKLESHEILFVHNFLYCWQIALFFLLRAWQYQVCALFKIQIRLGDWPIPFGQTILRDTRGIRCTKPLSPRVGLHIRGTNEWSYISCK